MAVPIKTWEAYRALGGADLPILAFIDPNDAHPVSYIESAGATDRAIGLNLSALLNQTNGLLVGGAVDVLNAGITVQKLSTQALSGVADTGGAIGSWVNPETSPIMIDEVIVTSSHINTTAACTMDVGTQASGTTLSDNLIDGIDIHGALLVGNSNITDPGSNGKASQPLAVGSFITFSTVTAGAAAGFVGKAYVKYTVLN